MVCRAMPDDAVRRGVELGRGADRPRRAPGLRRLTPPRLDRSSRPPERCFQDVADGDGGAVCAARLSAIGLAAIGLAPIVRLRPRLTLPVAVVDRRSSPKPRRFRRAAASLSRCAAADAGDAVAGHRSLHSAEFLGSVEFLGRKPAREPPPVAGHRLQVPLRRSALPSQIVLVERWGPAGSSTCCAR